MNPTASHPRITVRAPPFVHVTGVWQNLDLRHHRDNH